MKTFFSFFIAAFLFTTTSSFSQDKSVFENANLVKEGNGAAYVQLNWKKGTENTAYYLVERSVDGNNYKQVALVFTAEDAQFADYKYKDRGFPTAGSAVYYRITIVNDQKELSYLPAKRVELSAANTTQTTLIDSEVVDGKK